MFQRRDSKFIVLIKLVIFLKNQLKLLHRDNPTGPVVVTERLSILLIGLGGFVVTVCFLGCCGACTDSVCFLAFVSLLILFH